MSCFQDLGFFFVHNKPEAEAKGVRMLSLCFVIQRSMRVNSLDFCLRVIVNEKPLDLAKTTSSVLSVIVNYSMVIDLFRFYTNKCEYSKQRKTYSWSYINVNWLKFQDFINYFTTFEILLFYIWTAKNPTPVCTFGRTIKKYIKLFFNKREMIL